jgi:hypothetical protein
LNDILAGMAALTAPADGLGEWEGAVEVEALRVDMPLILTTALCLAVKIKLLQLFYELMAYKTTQG